MAYYDFVPVICFLIGGFFLIKICLFALQKYLTWLMTVGITLIGLGGAFQATWKLLYTAGIANIAWMKNAQFIFMSFGYLGILTTVIMLSRQNKKITQALTSAMAVWKIPFLMIMTFASLATYAYLASISIQRHLRLATAGFIIAFSSVLAMGLLASQPQTVSLQWLEQSINTLGNLSFAVGAFLLHKNYTASNSTPFGEGKPVIGRSRS